MAGFKRGGARGGGGGNFKKSTAKKRASPDDEDDTPRASKRTKADEDEDDAQAVVPKLSKDEDGNDFVSLNTSGKRRVTVSEFKDNTLISIREYWANDKGELKPGKKGIALTVDQYQTLLSSAPLLESVLAKKGIDLTRPDYELDLSTQNNEDGEGEHDTKRTDIKVDESGEEA